MIVQFPTPYPEELLYSTIGRYHLRSANISWVHTLEDLFGKRTTNATALLPSNVQMLVERLPKNTTLNESLFVEKHTMYPFFTAFLQKEQAKEIYHSILSEDGKTIYMRAGIMASAIPQNKYYHYCPKCLQVQENEFGETYWDRLQQLPGVLICLKHGIWLEESTIPLVQYDKCSYILPNRDNCKIDTERFVNESLKEEFLRLLNEIQLLLNTPSKQYSFTEWTNIYQRKLIESGYANRNGRVNQIKLQQDFFLYYSKEFLLNLGIKTTYWLREITQKHRKSFHPYYHLLLMNFLELTVNDLFSDTQTEEESKELTRSSLLNITSPQYNKDFTQKYSEDGFKKTEKKNVLKRIERLDKERKAWLQLQEQHPTMSKTELRKNKPSIYSYLNRYDRSWLSENSPKLAKRKVVNNRVDWQKRDREVLKRVIKATDELLSRRENLRRITIKSLGDETGDLALIDKQLIKMPETKAYIGIVKESDKDFRKRRVERVIERMKAEGEQIKVSKVLRKARIKTKFHDEVRGFIQLYVDGY